jgi:hypothetical protein
MGFLRDLFGPSKEEIWRQLATETGATYVDGGTWNGDKVQAHVKQWVVTLDTYTVNTGKTTMTFTRIRAPYVNADGFRFKIYRHGFFSSMGKALGMQDVEIGRPEFDEPFIIQGSSATKLRQLFAHEKIRELILQQPHFSLEVKDDEGWFSTHFPEGVDELVYIEGGIITDVERLKQLYALFAEILHQLCRIGSAYKRDPEVEL